MIKLCLLFFSINLFSSENISVAISSTPNNIVPFYSTDANSQGINKLIHKSLVDFDHSMNIVCELCESYQLTFKDQKEIVSFKLKKNITFKDGTRLDSEVVKKSFDYYLTNQEIKSSFMDSLENLEEFKVEGEFDFKLIFKKHSSENVINLNALKILKFKNSKIEVDDVKNILGLGEYELSNYSPLSIKLVSKLNPNKSFDFKVVKDETTLALKLINNEIDISTITINARKLKWLKENNKNLNFSVEEGSNYTYMALNQFNGKFSDIRIRKAISYLIPRQEILNYQLMDSVTLSNGMFSKAFEKVHTNDPIDEYNPKRAFELFHAAGFKLNKNNLLEKEGKIFSIDWKVSNNKSSIELVEILKNYFKRYGVTVNYQIMEWGSFMKNFKSGNFDIVISQWVGFTSPDMLRFVFHSENIPPKGGNRIRYINKNFDQIIDLAAEDQNPESALKNYRKAYDLINEDMPYVSLWHPKIIWIFQSCINGVKTDSFGSFKYLEKVSKENCYGRKKI